MKSVRTYSIAEIPIRIESELAISDTTFDVKFEKFRISDSVNAAVVLRHHFSIPEESEPSRDFLISDDFPWRVYRLKDGWTYWGITPSIKQYWYYGKFNKDYSIADIYHPGDSFFQKGNLQSLSGMPSDQLYLAYPLALLQAFYIHAAGIVYKKKGYLFVGHSGAGKSTITKKFISKGKILCDDRMIVRQWQDGLYIHGNWSHGEVPVVANDKAPLDAIFFLHKSSHNALQRMNERKSAVAMLLSCLVRPVVTQGWLDRVLSVMKTTIESVPIYDLYFTKDGSVVEMVDSHFS